MPATHTAAKLNRQRLLDWVFRKAAWFFTALVFVLLAALLLSLLIGSWPAMQAFGFDFLFSAQWNPVTEKFGALVPIIGTLVTSLIALSIGVPVSFGIALFLTELSPPWLRRPLGTAIELLAGIPSIIYGMWGLFVFAPFFLRNIYNRACRAHSEKWPESVFCLKAP